ncbi:hypothetical protein [Mycoplasma todarodis]|uniref:hypothetical protein n=1 Tax=Mycoplasma todarodis TaxID=1937191 RepID=UPI003B39D09C
MLILFIISTLLMPFMVSLLWKKQHVVSIYVVSFVSVLLVINVLNSWVINIWVIRILFILGYAFLYSFLGFVAIKNKKINLENLVKTFKWILPLYVSMGLMFFVRLWFTRMNTDALWYANISNYIQGNKMITDDPVYKITSFYSFAALFPKPINVFSFGGDVIVISILSTALFKIIDDAREERDWFTWLIIVIVSLVASLTLPFVTSSLNWVIVSLVIIVMFAIKDDIKLFLLTPIAFTIFSFSSMLLLPVALIYVLLAKKFTLKNIIDIIVVFVMSNVIFAIALLKLSNKLMIIPFLLTPILFLSYTRFIKEIEINGLILLIQNRIVKQKDLQEKKWTKKQKHISLIISVVIGLMVISAIIYFTDRRNSSLRTFSKIITDYYIWMIPCFIWIILNSLWNRKMTSWVKIIVSYILTITFYSIVIKIYSRVPSYIFYRTAEPVSLMVLSLFVIFIYENYSWKKFNWKLSATLVVSTLLPVGLVVEVSIPKYFYSNPSTNIEENYKWIKDSEWKTIEKFTSDNPNKKVYSDLPIFIMETKGRKKNTIMTATGQRELFHGDMFVSMKGRIKYLEENLENIQKDVDNDGIFKWTIEYAEMYGDWSKINPTDTFIFRHKEYADRIIKHYKTSRANKPLEIKNLNGLYVVSM